MVDLSAITGPVGRLSPPRRTASRCCATAVWRPAPSRRRSRSSRASRCTGCGATSRPTAGPVPHPPAPPVLMVHPMMMSADMWDVTREEGAVGILHKAGIDPWVIDFGSPDQVEGGMQRNLADHVVALSEAIDTVKKVTGRDVHLAGYSQGGMFAYQTAAYRRSKDLASIVAFGSPVDTLAALPMNLPAEHRAPRPPTSWPTTCSAGSTSRAGWRAPASRCSTRSRPRSRGSTSCASCTTARRCCRASSSADSWRSEGWIAWSGPAIAELLKQFIAHNRMMTRRLRHPRRPGHAVRHRLPGAGGRR